MNRSALKNPIMIRSDSRFKATSRPKIFLDYSKILSLFLILEFFILYPLLFISGVQANTGFSDKGDKGDSFDFDVDIRNGVFCGNLSKLQIEKFLNAYDENR